MWLLVPWLWKNRICPFDGTTLFTSSKAIKTGIILLLRKLLFVFKKGRWSNSDCHYVALGSSWDLWKGLVNWFKIFQICQNQRPLFILPKLQLLKLNSPSVTQDSIITTQNFVFLIFTDISFKIHPFLSMSSRAALISRLKSADWATLIFCLSEVKECTV